MSTCKCGCGKEIVINYRPWRGMPQYIRGHSKNRQGTGKWTITINGEKVCKNCNGKLGNKPLPHCDPYSRHREYYFQCREKSRERDRRLRLEVLNHYGGKCVCCGFNDLTKYIRHISFLTIDHTEGNRPPKHSLHARFYVWIKQHNFPNNLRILCFPCNVAMNYRESICELHKWEKGLL